jgi:hypothetical protein|nr:hypothetical protein RP007_05521 [Rhizobium sp. P007]
MTTASTVTISGTPNEKIAAVLTVPPRSTIAISRMVLAANVTPGPKRGFNPNPVRSKVPARIAATRPST